MTGEQIAIFCDFDGTVARRDVGYHLFHHFSGGRNDALLPDWKAGRLSTRDCLRLEAEMVRAAPDEILAFLDGFDLDPTFPRFARFCREHDLPLVILSEGMDFYIKKLLGKHGLDGLTVFSNIGHFENGGLRIEFPHRKRTCAGCGNCKAARIAEYRHRFGGDCRAIFIGDGYSDACGAGEADEVFAKKDLQKYCDAEGISYNAFADFDDVINQLVQRGFPAER